MAHFNQAFPTASGTLVTGGKRHGLREISVPPARDQNELNAKQRRLSRPNNVEEIRRKRRVRNKKRRMKKRKLSREVTIHHIEKANIHDLVDVRDSKIGEGTFGICVKKLYRGHVVAVKHFKHHSTASDVEKEAMMINCFDHPGLPFVFGMHTTSKPYLIITEFYGIGGECVTIANAVKGKLSLSIPDWALVLKNSSSALLHIHSKGFIHCDIKSDNIVIRNDNGVYEPVIIDFGKMKKINQAKKYKLAPKEQDRYLKYHKHIAPEVVWGRNPQSTSSDIYSLGNIISLVVYYNRSQELQAIAKRCIHGTPEKRPSIVDVISDLHAISQCNGE